MIAHAAGLLVRWCLSECCISYIQTPGRLLLLFTRRAGRWGWKHAVNNGPLVCQLNWMPCWCEAFRVCGFMRTVCVNMREFCCSTVIDWVGSNTFCLAYSVRPIRYTVLYICTCRLSYGAFKRNKIIKTILDITVIIHMACTSSIPFIANSC